MDIFKPKTNKKEVFDYISKMEAMSLKHSKGKHTVTPTGGQIALVFGITRQRANQYLQRYKKLMDK